MRQCPYCTHESETREALWFHVRRCDMNPNPDCLKCGLRFVPARLWDHYENCQGPRGRSAADYVPLEQRAIIVWLLKDLTYDHILRTCERFSVNEVDLRRWTEDFLLGGVRALREAQKPRASPEEELRAMMDDFMPRFTAALDATGDERMTGLSTFLREVREAATKMK